MKTVTKMRSLFVRIIILFLHVLLITTAIHLADVMIAQIFDVHRRRIERGTAAAAMPLQVLKL
jgi:hypothetical protein